MSIALILSIALAAPAAATDSAEPGAAKEPLICKRETPVGSLIATRKMCLTKTQWRQRSDTGNAIARSLVEDGAGACGSEGGCVAGIGQ